MLGPLLGRPEGRGPGRLLLLSLFFYIPQPESKQKSTGIKEGSMSNIKISSRPWINALIDKIGLDNFLEV